LAELTAEGRIRRVAPRRYVSVSEPKTEATVRAAWATIVQRLFRASSITHRTALEFVPSPAGEVFITAGSNREVPYPGPYAPTLPAIALSEIDSKASGPAKQDADQVNRSGVAFEVQQDGSGRVGSGR